jgi:hypothetical protein
MPWRYRKRWKSNRRGRPAGTAHCCRTATIACRSAASPKHPFVLEAFAMLANPKRTGQSFYGIPAWRSPSRKSSRCTGSRTKKSRERANSREKPGKAGSCPHQRRHVCPRVVEIAGMCQPGHQLGACPVMRVRHQRRAARPVYGCRVVAQEHVRERAIGHKGPAERILRTERQRALEAWNCRFRLVIGDESIPQTAI